MAGKGGSLTWKLFATVSAVTAGIVTRKVLTAAFRKTTGKPPPANPEAPSTSWQEAVAWAVVSGAALGLARMLATRKAAAVYQKSTGHLPAGLEEVS
jgi:Protein of unknown function (DUF4235)